VRRTIGLVLIALGVFAVTFGLFLRFYSYPQLAKLPLDVNKNAVDSGTATDVLEVGDGGANLQIRHGVPLTTTAHIEGNLLAPDAKPNGDIAVWHDNGRTTDDQGNVVSAYNRQVCLNRSTGAEATGCQRTEQFYSNAQDAHGRDIVDYVAPQGQVYTFPFGTGKHDYLAYDVGAQRATEAHYAGTTSIDGLNVYKFTQVVPDIEVQAEQVPGSLVGLPEQSSVDVAMYYHNTRTLWVEPATGTTVQDEEQPHQEMRVINGNVAPTVIFNATMSLTPASVQSNVDSARAGAAGMGLLSLTAPLALGIGGVVIVLGGVAVLVVRRRRPVGRSTETVPISVSPTP
jgi:hypothetical protein